MTATCSASPVQGGTLMALGVSITSFFRVFLFPAWARIRLEQARAANRGTRSSMARSSQAKTAVAAVVAAAATHDTPPSWCFTWRWHCLGLGLSCAQCRSKTSIEYCRGRSALFSYSSAVLHAYGWPRAVVDRFALSRRCCCKAERPTCACVPEEPVGFASCRTDKWDQQRDAGWLMAELVLFCTQRVQQTT